MLEKNELALEKQGVAAIRDWDVFQAVIRVWSHRMRQPWSEPAKRESRVRKER